MQEDAETCSPTGLECYENIQVDRAECLAPCYGIFADIDHQVRGHQGVILVCSLALLSPGDTGG